MKANKLFLISSLIAFTFILTSCSGKTAYRDSCGNEVDAAWNELSLAKTKGLVGTVSYTKAASHITAARTMQAVENFDACYKEAKKARTYIRASYKGH